MHRFLAMFLAALITACQQTPTALEARTEAALTTEHKTLSVKIDGASYKLDGLMVRPADAAKSPLAILTHGTCGSACRARRSTSDLRSQAEVFARAGFAAFILMRRGYNGSDGPYSEDFGGCATQNYTKAANATANDIQAAIATLQSLPYIDGDKVIAVGQSGGGIGVVALAARTPHGLKAVINFSGGRGGSCIRNGVYDEAKGIDTFKTFGAVSRMPTLWIYTKSDDYWGPSRPVRWHERFVGAGGKAEFVHLPPIGEKGHSFFYRESSISIWQPIVAQFLQQNF